jgi:hypothetical protein
MSFKELRYKFLQRGKSVSYKKSISRQSWESESGKHKGEEKMTIL